MQNVATVLREEYPQGIDVAYEGVGGRLRQAVLQNLTPQGRPAGGGLHQLLPPHQRLCSEWCVSASLLLIIGWFPFHHAGEHRHQHTPGQWCPLCLESKQGALALQGPASQQDAEPVIACTASKTASQMQKAMATPSEVSFLNAWIHARSCTLSHALLRSPPLPPCKHGLHAGSNGAAANGQHAEELTDEQIFWGGKTVQDGGRTIYGSVWPKVRPAPLQDLAGSQCNNVPSMYYHTFHQTHGGQLTELACNACRILHMVREGRDQASMTASPGLTCLCCSC